MSGQYHWHFCRYALQCKCVAGFCDHYDKKLCDMNYKDKCSVKKTEGCVAFPKRWEIMYTTGEEKLIEQELGLRV